MIFWSGIFFRLGVGTLILDKVVSLTTNQNARCVALMILLGATSSELTFSAFDVSILFGLICL